MARTQARTQVRRALTVAISGLAVLVMVPSAGAATKTASVVSSADGAKLGSILVAGTTVYTLKPTKTACTAACMDEWPPVLLPHGVKKPTAGTGVDGSQLGTAKLGTRGLQITYAGKRLYWSAKDKKSGQVHATKNKWGKWSTVTVAAAAASTTAPATTTPPTEAPTQPPATAAPQTSPPETAPPATAPPETQPTSPPPTQPTSTTSGGNGGIGF